MYFPLSEPAPKSRFSSFEGWVLDENMSWNPMLTVLEPKNGTKECKKSSSRFKSGWCMGREIYSVYGMLSYFCWIFRALARWHDDKWFWQCAHCSLSISDQGDEKWWKNNVGAYCFTTTLPINKIDFNREHISTCTWYVFFFFFCCVSSMFFGGSGPFI